MTIRVRRMQPQDARLFLEIHRASVRGLAAEHYPSAVIDAWAPLPITHAAIEHLLRNLDHEIRLIAARDEEDAGIGALVIEKSELRGCYVLPTAARTGVGSAIVREIERIARQQKVASLHLVASVNAAPFYIAQGYKIQERGEHTLHSGQRMACVKMFKVL